MTEQRSEHLSAFMDGASDDPSILDEVLQQPELAEKWQRYHLIGDALRRELPNELHLDFSDKVAAALEEEPTVIGRPRVEPEVAQDDLDSDSVERDNVVGLRGWFRQGSQFAVAASVAVAVILGVQQFNQPQVEEPFSAAPVLRVPGIEAGLAPVSLEQTRAVPRSDVAEQRRRINAYINDHQQQLRNKETQQQEQSAVNEAQPDRETADNQPN